MISRLGLFVMLALTISVAGCAFDPYSDISCSADGERSGDRVCRNGVWVDDSTGALDGGMVAADTGSMDVGPADADGTPDSGGMMDAGGGDDMGSDAEADTCVPETDEALCQAALANCGTIEVTDSCGASRTPQCGMCTDPETCGGAGEPNRCGCQDSDDTRLCQSVGAECGTISIVDPSCGVEREVMCGSCTAPETCGGGGTDNMCGCTETQADFCARLGANCGMVTAPDACGDMQTYDCGTCSDPEQCGAGGTANVCGCDEALVCDIAAAQCGVIDLTGRCSNIANTDCGDCGASGTCMNEACSCDQGYAYDDTSGVCEDIDECSTGADDCDANASCTNTDGSFTCACNAGFTGDGTTCTPVFPTVAESVSTADTLNSTVTTPSLTAVEGSLYVAFVAVNTDSRTVQSVTGLGQTFTQQLDQCSGDDNQYLQIWTMQAPAGATDGGVTVQLNQRPYAVSVAVVRIDGVRTASDPVVRTGSANTASGGACSGGMQASSFNGTTTSLVDRSVNVLGWSRPGVSISLGAPWTLRESPSSSGALLGRDMDMSLYTADSQGAGVPVPIMATFGGPVHYIGAVVEVAAP